MLGLYMYICAILTACFRKLKIISSLLSIFVSFEIPQKLFVGKGAKVFPNRLMLTLVFGIYDINRYLSPFKEISGYSRNP